MPLVVSFSLLDSRLPHVIDCIVDIVSWITLDCVCLDMLVMVKEKSVLLMRDNKFFENLMPPTGSSFEIKIF